jgi:hypothetical protein
MLDVIHINTYTQNWALKACGISRGLCIITKHVSHNVQNVGSNHIYNFTQENPRK